MSTSSYVGLLLAMQDYFQICITSLCYVVLLIAMQAYFHLFRPTLSYAGLLPVMQGKEEEEEKMQEYF